MFLLFSIKLPPFNVAIYIITHNYLNVKHLKLTQQYFRIYNKNSLILKVSLTILPKKYKGD